MDPMKRASRQIRAKKTASFLLRFFGFLVSCGLPIYAVARRFPLFREGESEPSRMSFGLFLSALILLFTFRKAVVNFLVEKWEIRHIPPVFFWGCALLVCLLVGELQHLVADLSAVCLYGLVGSALGALLIGVGRRLQTANEREARFEN